MILKTLLKKISAFLILLIIVSPFIISNLFRFGVHLYWIFSLVLSVLTLISLKYYKNIFPTILFFTLIHLLRPVNFKFVSWVGISFPGTFYLIPIILFTGLILVFPGIKKRIGWWTKDRFDKKTLFLIIGLVLLTGIGLLIWNFWIADDLSTFTNNLPDVPLFYILINGIGFALFNALAEEYLSRGMLCNGLEKIDYSISSKHHANSKNNIDNLLRRIV